MRDSCGSSGTGETPQAKTRRLTARPAESEHHVVEIKRLVNNNKGCENSLKKRNYILFYSRI
ncbi:hypothetical protein CUU66_11315 [Peribacillus deserti]|uniref:Uncharacterized protein n=1 Tax=Peribacillus deserti TaxID=673318 RepID=A0A2N5M5Y8_9BACI|nr:hypothetical protein CUU66_11315 [Peribacillus deserti]